MSSERSIVPVSQPPEATVRPPGSKSLTNRALLLAAMADGQSIITGALDADDIFAMISAVTALGAEVREDWTNKQLSVTPCSRLLGDDPPVVNARLSGTTARFVLPVAAALRCPVFVDGAPPLRKRPIGPLVDALRVAGAKVTYHGEEGCLPLTVDGTDLHGGTVEVDASFSSQYLSALLLGAPTFPEGLTVHAPGVVVAKPFVDLTVDALGAFGVEVERPDDTTFVVARQPIHATTYDVEPDATSASYFFAAAAITGGCVTLDGLGTTTRQGDMAFLEVLAEMGAHVERRAHQTVVQGGDLRGIDVDLSAIPDTALTLAAVAVFADGPTRVRGVGYIRGHETDRVAAVVAELRRLGIEAEETNDGFVVTPGPIRPATIRTYQDHRMAMSFSLIGLRAAGVTIEDPGVVDKTYPTFFDDLARLGSGPPVSGR